MVLLGCGMVLQWFSCVGFGMVLPGCDMVWHGFAKVFVCLFWLGFLGWSMILQRFWCVGFGMSLGFLLLKLSTRLLCYGIFVVGAWNYLFLFGPGFLFTLWVLRKGLSRIVDFGVDCYIKLY